MSSVDNRIVKMVFDNAQFKRGAAETKQSLSDVDRAVATSGRGKGLLNLSNAMSSVSLTASKMSVITTTAIATIANKAVNAGLEITKSLTIDPIKSGFGEYESLLSKQNVIMNATGKSAGEVKKTLNDLNHYSDKTIFSFADMTEALTSFVNAGVPLPKASKAMQGIANASALAGASTVEAQSSFRAFSQALGQGFLGLQDYRQAAVTGKIGTVQFKQALIDAAVANGTLTKRNKEYVTASGKTLTATKGFDLSLQEQWANTNVLNDALEVYGDQTTKTGKKAFKAAQDVRTFSAFMDTFKESIGSGFAQLFTTMIGGLEESTAKWTGLSNTVGAATQGFFNFTNSAIKTFQSLGGGAKVMEGLKNIASPFVALFKAIGDAWASAFPTDAKGAGGILYSLAAGFAAVTSPLQYLATGIEHITPFLSGFFKLVKMGGGGLSHLAGLLEDAAGSLLKMFNIKAPSGAGGIQGFVESIISALGKLADVGGDTAKLILDGIADGFTNANIDTVTNVIGTGLLFSLYKAVKKNLVNINIGGGLTDSIKNSFDTLTGSLQGMQAKLKADVLQSIAVAVGTLTASLLVLSLIKGDDLKKSLLAVSVGLGQLLLALAALQLMGGFGAALRLPLIAAGLTAIAAAALILSLALAVLSRLSWEEIGRGMTALAGSLIVIGLAMKLMPTTLPITGAGLILVGIGINAIAAALAIMGNLEWETIGKGLTAMAGALLIIAGAMQLMPATLPITAAGLVLVGIAVNGIATALLLMSTMSWESIGKGLATLGGAMAILSIGLNTMSGTLLGSAALLVAAGAINILVPALILLSGLSLEQIGSAMLALGGGLLILAVAMAGMTAALPGAAALLIVAPAIFILANALLLLSTLSWEALAVALVALAAGLTVIGVAGLLIAPVVPALLGLGAALLLMGAGLALAGVGLLAFSAGLAALVALGAGAVIYLSKYVEAFIELLPKIGEGLGLALVAFGNALADNAPHIVDSFVELMSALISGARRLLPKLPPLITSVNNTMIAILVKAIPKYSNAGVDIITGVLKGIAKRMPKLADAAGDLVAAFLRGLGDQSGKIADAGLEMIIDFVNALTAAIDAHSDELVEAFKDLGVAMGKGLVKGIGSLAGEAADAAKNMAKGAIDKAKSILHINSPSKVFIAIGKGIVEGMTMGIQNNAVAAITATAALVSGQIATANEYISKFIQDLDQKALVAQGKAEGLARAADRAQRAADKTKTKKDDKSADRLSDRAKAADRDAARKIKAAEKAKAKQDRDDEFAKTDLFGKAKMRSEDAQTQLDAAKASELRAAKELAEANALDREARNKNYSSKERKRMEKEADALRKKARADAKAADKHIDSAKAAAVDALKYQKLAGDEAAALFQKQFEEEAKADADTKAFNKLSDAEKADLRRKQAADLQTKADADLAAAQKLAYTNLEGANDLAAKALDEAEQARKYLDEATTLSNTAPQSGSVASGSVVNLDPTEAAAIAMSQYEDLYDSSYAAAAGDRKVEFNQYNTSPEALSPIEVYRQTNNLFNYAVEKIDEAAV